MRILAERLRAARQLRGISQGQLAAKTTTTREAISMVEHGKSGLSFARMAAAARALDVSTDYLYGLTETPTPADRLAHDLAVADPRYAVDDSHALADPGGDGDYIGVSELSSAAGSGAVVDDERVTGRLKFRQAWLARHGLVARYCRVIHVLGESMEPTLVDGCVILVNRAGRQRRVGRVYVVRTEDGLVVKRAGKDPAGAWQLVSDNPDKRTWPSRPWPPDAEIVGEVTWTARTFV